MALVRDLRLWFSEGLWKTRSRDLPRSRRIPVKLLKIALLSGRSFQKEQDSIQASALTLYTLLSIVPVTALLFGIAKGFSLDARLEEWLLTQFAEQQDVLRRTVVMARRTLDDAQGGLVAGAGVIFLLYTVIKVIDNIEQAFNRTWAVARSRTWARKFTDYLSLFLVCPFVLLGASSLNVYVGAVLSRAAEAGPLDRVAVPAVTMALGAAPLILLWALFTFLYVFIPNTKVRIPSALFAGAISAFLYQMVQTLYIGLQVGVSRTNAIYGSFAALPLFIIWLQLSWRIVLLGAVITHQHQNFEANEREEHVPELSFRAVKRLALRICGHLSSRFLEGKPPLTAEALAETLAVPPTVLAPLLTRLVKAGILVEAALEDPEEPGYCPARDPHKLTPSVIVEALENQGEDLAEAPARSGEPAYEELLQEFDRCLESHPVNRPLARSSPDRSWSSRH